MFSRLLALVVLATCSLSASAATITRIEAHPKSFQLNGSRRTVQLVITGFHSNGETVDLTSQAILAPALKDIIRLDATTVLPLADGETPITIEAAGHKTAVSVTVTGMGSPEPVSFQREVLPVLSRQGCSSGACHGSPHGKGGFRLSLRASDPALDAETMTRESMGQRVAPLNPEQSLLLRKPLMQVSHGGGRRIRRDDPEYTVLRDWIAAGCQIDVPESARLKKLELYPPRGRVLRHPSRKQQVSAIAHFEDGSIRDVTRYTVFSTSDESIATVTSNGLVTGERRGEMAVIARYLGRIETTSLTFVRDIEGFVWSNPLTANYVDEHVYAKLKQLQFEPAGLCSDSEFVRRVHLDITGSLPSVEATRSFLADKSPDKRQRLIDVLLTSPDFSRFWTVRWGDLLRMSQKQVGARGLPIYYEWVRKSFEQNQRYDEFVTALLTSDGNTLQSPAANYYRTEASTDDAVETTAQTFLGVRIQCAKCHNHPFEKWTQTDYYGLSTFFSQVQRKRVEKPHPKDKKKKLIDIVIAVEGSGEVRHPQSNKVMKPWAPSAGEFQLSDDTDRRRAFASWLTAADNPFLARVEVNRIWAYVLGRGIVEPFDDFRESNPPSNAELLDALAVDFIRSGFDRRHILRTILNSRTYQASSQTTRFNQEDDRCFSHYSARRLSAEQLLDAISHTTGVPDTFAGHPPGTKATQLMAPDIAANDFLKVFGQPERQTACQCERATDPSLPQALSLFNGGLLQSKLKKVDNRFHKQLAAKKPLSEIVTELYLAAFSREPSKQELAISLEYVQSNSNAGLALEDLCWALLNRNEFLFQH